MDGLVVLGLLAAKAAYVYAFCYDHKARRLRVWRNQFTAAVAMCGGGVLLVALVFGGWFWFRGATLGELVMFAACIVFGGLPELALAGYQHNRKQVEVIDRRFQERREQG